MTNWTSADFDSENDVTNGEPSLEFEGHRLTPADFETYPPTSASLAVPSVGSATAEIF
jgi:hypothetical protein